MLYGIVGPLLIVLLLVPVRGKKGQVPKTSPRAELKQEFWR